MQLENEISSIIHHLKFRMSNSTNISDSLIAELVAGKVLSDDNAVRLVKKTALFILSSH